MVRACVSIKNGDEYGHNDLLVDVVDFIELPKENQILRLSKYVDGFWETETFLVKEVVHELVKEKDSNQYSRHCITVYVVKID